MKLLQDILYKVRLQEVYGNTDMEISGLYIDSRKVISNAVFIAIKGEQADGHLFIEAAIANGAIVIVAEVLPLQFEKDITYIKVNSSHEAVAFMAHNFYDCPSEKLTLVGVTGTNGKTTVATLLYKLFSGLGYSCGLISTVQNQINQNIIPATHTTPDAISLNALLQRMVTENCSHVFMECSSHAIHQHRITGLQFKGAIFTNITLDHLDYHKTFEEYIRVKKSFFDNLTENAFALSNKDDKRGELMLQNTRAVKYYYSLKASSDFKGKILDNALTGLQMLINKQEVHFRLIGEFNAYNLLAVYGTALCLKEDSEKILTVLSGITGAEGRFDYIISKNQVIGIVDYAHTPDALENVLTTLIKLKKDFQQIITVVGCGGDRDKTKRPIMAQAACDLSSKAIFTSDNPRTENPLDILADMEKGLTTAAKKKYVTIPDRKQAIEQAVKMANSGDIILIAGKGHEKYQEINGVKYPFDDKQVLQEMFSKSE
ncbi:MAG: UDP-N-acetylmuramoyl-L-alanyl-D-glutamate--2,6-diaminopimelate ligase [Sphingobacteriales bacterium]|uniref:UDP-N-acetylmuramoyl-L-alanyl-D-glutamate--2, 6-diaminopimelate ligase n=1 Tax=Hydrotalea flava TaxID=714549 RepID=UPI0008330AE0|nr:UDP-N-acetylmuramoyl-L-alanyl-D-glutamate--2,6-diaminopimelate ligase [Hydrotalea flava]RTL55111.1 MAG: UDP-N-acetylmuramoyl-L-alanyl-D-glutamate--2,6-diaminopimelate ligase [Sphingobacteriales bacterium]